MRPNIVLALCPLALVTLVGCRRAPEPEPVSTTSVMPGALPAAPATAPAAPAATQEQTIETAPTQPKPGPILTSSNMKVSKVRTVSDENLPRWVPKRGRLTVVESSDLAENLGLVPQGTTASSDERISAAKLAEQNARTVQNDSMARGTSWSYAGPGRVRNRR